MIVKMYCTTDQRNAQSVDDKGKITWIQQLGLSGTDLRGAPVPNQVEGVGNVSMNATITGALVGEIQLGELVEVAIRPSKEVPSTPNTTTNTV